MWQADITHWLLEEGGHAEILNMLDDHSRLFLASWAFPTVKAADVVDVFRMAIARHGAPASLLCDNGAVFTAAWHPRQELAARVKARPLSAPSADTYFRVRHDKVDSQGTVTLRHDSKLHHIGIGRAHKGRAIKLLVADRDIRVLDRGTGELIRQLTLDPSRATSRSEEVEVSTMSRDICLDVAGHHKRAADGIRTHDLLHGNYAGLRESRAANIAVCRAFAETPRTARISNTRGCAPICSDLGTSAQKCPRSGRPV